MYKVEVTGNSPSSFKVKSKDYEFIVDIKGAGITPPDTLLASLGSCVGVYLRKYCEGVKIALGDFKITVDADLGNQQPFCFKKINVVIDLKGIQLDDRHREALLRFLKNCPVHNTLEARPQVEMNLI